MLMSNKAIKTLIVLSMVFLFSGCGRDGEAIYDWKTTSKWVSKSQDPDPEKRIEAVDALGKIGGEGLDLGIVMPALVKALEDESRVVRRKASNGIVGVGPAALPELITLIEKENKPVYNDLMDRLLAEAAGRALELSSEIRQVFIPEAPEDSVSAAVDAMGSVETLSDIISRNDIEKLLRAYSAIKNAMRGSDVIMKTRFTRITASIWDDDMRSFIGLLEVGTEDDRPAARKFAEKTLQTIDEELKETLSILSLNLKGDDLHLSRASAAACAAIGIEAVPLLIEALKNEDPDVRLISLEELEKMDEQKIFFLAKSFDEIDDEYIKLRLVASIALIDPESARFAIPFLEKLDSKRYVENAAYYLNKGSKTELTQEEVADIMNGQVRSILEMIDAD